METTIAHPVDAPVPMLTLAVCGAPVTEVLPARQ